MKNYYRVRYRKLKCVRNGQKPGEVGNLGDVRGVDAGWYKFRELLTAKCDKYNRQLVVINRWEATYQKCSYCGFNGGKKNLNVREWQCLNCGTAHDKNINAANNIRHVLWAIREYKRT